jgi:hypothetical protein
MKRRRHLAIFLVALARLVMPSPAPKSGIKPGIEASLDSAARTGSFDFFAL